MSDSSKPHYLTRLLLNTLKRHLTDHIQHVIYKIKYKILTKVLEAILTIFKKNIVLCFITLIELILNC